ncbi:hypothetical protein GC163_01415 [bacterium]|nr:hypothetical protein [bacterium]
MSTAITTVALGLAMQVGQPAPQETPNYPALPNAYNQYGFEGQFEQRHPFDTQQNWVHGYFQEIPAYGGHTFYRPYNYKDVMSQSQTAAGWGASPTLPYSQQFWHRYHDQATMLKLSQQGQPSHDQANMVQTPTMHPTHGMQPGMQPMYHPSPVMTPQPSQGPAMTPPMAPNAMWSMQPNHPAATNSNIVVPASGLMLPQQPLYMPAPAFAPAPQQQPMLYPAQPTAPVTGPNLPAF